MFRTLTETGYGLATLRPGGLYRLKASDRLFTAPRLFVQAVHKRVSDRLSGFSGGFVDDERL
jgi:hypothetical protein